MMRWGSIIFSLPAILLLSLYGWELSSVNDCIDQGLSYNFELEQCIDGKQDIRSPFYARHTFFVNSMLLLSVVGSIMMTVAMIQRGMQRD
ncbi:hypothetical protein A9R00_04445 [Oleispira antarctica]|uniref:Uncharacterized protein n=1 Tax=Oleispira antarctica TaxID=188908 RepID=A0A1Y5HXW0_OLEAN|nr:hypothetical protein A9R00_04445 [Oleispira antarctica]